MLEGVGLNEFRVVQLQYYTMHLRQRRTAFPILLWLQSLVLHKVVTG